MRFALLPEAEQRATWPATAGPFRALTSVQLRARHWIIRDGRGDVTGEVRGEAVVGEYPILTPGAPGGVDVCQCAAVFIGRLDAVHSETHKVHHVVPSGHGPNYRAVRRLVWLCSMPCMGGGAECIIGGIVGKQLKVLV